MKHLKIWLIFLSAPTILIVPDFIGSVVVEGTGVSKQYNGEQGRCMPPKQGRHVPQ